MRIETAKFSPSSLPELPGISQLGNGPAQRMKLLWMSWLKWLTLASLTLQGTNGIPLHSTITLWEPVTSFGMWQCPTKVLEHYDLYFYLCHPWTPAVGFLVFLSSISLSWSNTDPLDFTEATVSHWKPPCFYSCLHKDAQDDVQGWVWVMVFPEMKQIWPFSNAPLSQLPWNEAKTTTPCLSPQCVPGSVGNKPNPMRCPAQSVLKGRYAQNTLREGTGMKVRLQSLSAMLTDPVTRSLL